MRGRLRISVLGAIAWLRSRLQQRPDPSHDHRETGKHSEACPNHSAKPATDVLRTEWVALQALIREIHESEKQHQAAEKQLGAAQLRTAKGLNRVTAIGAAVGAIGLVFVGLSLLVTKQAANDSHESSIAAGRAWVGPVDAKISAIPSEPNQEIIATVSVRNTGRQPALDFTWNIVSQAVNPINATFDEEVNKYVAQCLITVPDKNSQVIYPSTGFGTGFEFSNKVAQNELDWDVIYGLKAIVVRGCIVYNNGYGVGHSAFCYFFTPGVTKDPAHLNICHGGSAAN